MTTLAFPPRKTKAIIRARTVSSTTMISKLTSPRRMTMGRITLMATTAETLTRMKMKMEMKMKI